MHARAQLAPFFERPGGRNWLRSRILDLVPARSDTYYEPFVGAGAVLVASARMRARFGAVLGNRFHVRRDRAGFAS
jgi:site-specific DNA-adenine methylase